MRKIPCLAVLVFCLMLAEILTFTAAHAAPGGSIGPVLPGATVSMVGNSTTTNSSGIFSISGIPAGTYTLTISKTGYYTKTITGFTVNCNRTGLMYYLVKKY